MQSVEGLDSYVEIIKALGPYIIAIASLGIGYIQSRKNALITKEKDLEIANLQKNSTFEMEQFKNKNAALLKLQEIYSPMLAKAESILHIYQGLISNKETPAIIKTNLEKFVVNDYMSFSVESRKAVLTEAIIICQVLKDHAAYEAAVELDNKITEAMSLIDFSGQSSGPEHSKKIIKVRSEYNLSYVSFFYRLTNLNLTANKSRNKDAASCTNS